MSKNLGIVQEKLFNKSHLGLSNFNLFPGSKKATTVEQFAVEINRVLTLVEAGDFEIVELLEDD